MGLATGEMHEIVQNSILKLPWQTSIMKHFFLYFHASVTISALILLKSHVTSVMAIGQVRDT